MHFPFSLAMYIHKWKFSNEFELQCISSYKIDHSRKGYLLGFVPGSCLQIVPSFINFSNSMSKIRAAGTYEDIRTVDSVVDFL